MYNGSMLNLGAFHDYDIRGLYPSEIDEEFYYHLGKSIATYIGTGTIGVGHDVRVSSSALYESMIEGITDYGINVVKLGMISTEMYYFASGSYEYDMTVIITASHNPGEYNGAKMVKKGVIAIHSGYGLPEIKAIMNRDLPKASKKGTIKEKDIFCAWIDHALSFVPLDKIKPLKVVVDAGSGMAGPTWKYLMKKLPIDILPMYLDPDGTFPHHLPDPLKDENVKELQATVVDTKADMGVAFDGDADRVFFIDGEGEKLSGTVSTAIFAEHFLNIEKGYVLYNALCGKVVRQTIERHGGKPERTRVGHSFIKEKMREHNALFAGEHSGHFYFRDNYYAESSLVASLLMMLIISEKDESLAHIAKQYRMYPPAGEMNFKVADADSTIGKLVKKYKAATDDYDELDGSTFWFKDWWFNVRKSKTEPLLRVTIEADTDKILKSRVSSVMSTIKLCGGVRK